MSRDITPRSDMYRKLGIIARPRHELAKAIVRNAGTGILRNGMDDDRFTAFDEYLGDYFANGLTLRGCVEMSLARGTCADNKIRLAKYRQLTKNGSRDSDNVIIGKCPNQRRRRIWVGCDMARELGPGLQLNHGDKRFERSE